MLLALPTLVLVVEAQRQLKWEAFQQQRTLADELGLRLDVELQRRIAAEEARGYADYAFLVVGGDPAASNFLQLSPLARFPVESALPGAVGYFQIDGGWHVQHAVAAGRSGRCRALGHLGRGAGAADRAARQPVRGAEQ